MGMDWNAAVDLGNKFLDSNVAKLLLLPLGYGGFRLFEYLVKRKAEGAGESRDMAALHSAVELREKLARQNMTLAQLREFRAQALGLPAQTAADTAQHYIERAQYLARPQGERQPVYEWPEANTQAEMNSQAAAQFAMADDELTALVIEKMASLDPEEATAFQETQDAWRNWRIAEAEWESKVWRGGSIRPLMVSTKLEQLTRERIASIHLSGDAEHHPRPMVVPYRNTPQGLADHIEPGTTGARVREILGTPHYITGNYWYYRFRETQVELHLSGEAVEEVAFAIVQGHQYTTTLNGFGPFTFGELTFGALQDLTGERLEIRHRSSMRTTELYTTLRLGHPGAGTDYYFGALIPHHGGGQLLSTEFDWDWENRTLNGFPSGTIINWFGATARFDEAPAISWFLR